MIYLLLGGILATWTALAIGRMPGYRYTLIYASMSVLPHTVELVTVGMFKLYAFPGGLLPDFFRDTRVCGAIAEYVIFPCVACLYCHYAGNKPLWWVLVPSLGLSALEVLFLHTGQLVYYKWSLWYSFPFYPTFFWLARKLYRDKEMLPAWLLPYMIGNCILNGTDLLLHGGYALWEHPVAPDPFPGRLLGFTLSYLQALLILWFRPPWASHRLGFLWAAGLLVLLDIGLYLSGLLTFSGWNLVYQGARYAITAWVMERYQMATDESRALRT